MEISELKHWFQQHSRRIQEDYFRFLSFPSISADPAYKKECMQCAEWLCKYLKQGNIHAELIPTPGLPLVYGEEKTVKNDAPTLLVYGHYDVQPVDPLDLWHTPPFEPTVKNGSIFARGAVDDKGQIFYAVLAILCWKELKGHLPVNLKFCIEGEEESASTGLAKALPHLKEKMKSDHLLVVDFGQFAKGIPAVSLGARGIISLEVSLTGSSADLHSGMYGGIAYNPNRALAELLAKLWDSNGRVQVPHFYDDVENLSQKTKAIFASTHDRKAYAKEAGIEAFGGEKGVSLQEANWFRPTLEINGMVGGYTGAGMKTVIPAKAHAKITCRLVPNQDPSKISHHLKQFLMTHAQPGMNVEVIEHGGEAAFRTNPESTLAQAIAKAASEVTGAECRYVVSGGSIPIIPALSKASGAEAIGMGYGLDTDQVHAPNEHFDMHRFEQGFLTVGRAIGLL